jgi:outer membrane protein assembly factor BamB
MAAGRATVIATVVATACGDTEAGPTDRADATAADHAGLRLLDALTGDEQWTSPMPGGWSTIPVIIGDRVVVQVADDCRDALDTTTMVAVDVSNGSITWMAPSATGCASAAQLPLVNSDGAVVLGDGLRGLDVSTGQQQWSRSDTSADLLTGVADLVLYVRHSGGAQLLDPATGTPGWTNAEIGGEPLLGGGNGLLASLEVEPGPIFRVRTIDAAVGQTNWTVETPFLERMIPPVVGPNVIVLSGSDGTAGDPMNPASAPAADVDAVVALAADDGRQLWQHEYRSPMPGVGLQPASVAVDVDRVYEMRPGVLEAFSARDGTSVWAVEVGSPTGMLGDLDVAGDTVLAVQDSGAVAADDARLVAVDARTGALRWTLDLGVPAWKVRVTTTDDRVAVAILGSWTSPPGD